MLQILHVAVKSVLFFRCIVLVSIFIISGGYPEPPKRFILFFLKWIKMKKTYIKILDQFFPIFLYLVLFCFMISNIHGLNITWLIKSLNLIKS